MGMFDWVDYECDCPKCGNLIDDFQSKQGNCNLEKIKPWMVSNFYASCSKCDEWVMIEVVAPTSVTYHLTHYTPDYVKLREERKNK